MSVVTLASTSTTSEIAEVQPVPGLAQKAEARIIQVPKRPRYPVGRVLAVPAAFALLLWRAAALVSDPTTVVFLVAAIAGMLFLASVALASYAVTER